MVKNTNVDADARSIRGLRAELLGYENSMPRVPNPGAWLKEKAAEIYPQTTLRKANQSVWGLLQPSGADTCTGGLDVLYTYRVSRKFCTGFSTKRNAAYASSSMTL